MKINLFKFKRQIKESLHEPKRLTSFQMLESDFNDILLLIREEEALSLSEVMREALHYGLQNEPIISQEIKRIKEKIENEKQKEIERLSKKNIDWNKV